MKLNWGHGIFITMAIFIVMMTSFMVRAFNNQEELVAEDYYAQELQYQERIDQMRNAGAAGEALRAEVSGATLTLVFPAQVRGKAITGQARLLKPNDSRADQVLPLAVDSAGRCTFDTRDWMKGAYHLQVDWAVAGVDHFSEDHIHIP
jgi:nitrogen fixation protein FixH